MVEQNRLTAARTADDGDDFPPFDRQVDAGKHPMRAEGLAQAVNPDFRRRAVHQAGATRARGGCALIPAP